MRNDPNIHVKLDERAPAKGQVITLHGVTWITAATQQRAAELLVAQVIADG